MVYLENITTPQRAFIPLNGLSSLPENVQLKITGTVSVDEYDIPVSVVSLTEIYADVKVSLPEGLPDGSYEYRLMLGEDTVSTGCLQIGNYEINRKEYGRTVEYRQYGEF